MKGISVRTTELNGVTVVTPTGRLDLSTYAALRDGLLKCAADNPRALVIRLGHDFDVASRAMLAVFTAVSVKVSQWPDIPVVLTSETEIHQHDLRRSGVQRFVPTAADVPAALALLERPPPRRFHRVTLPCSPTSATVARAETREACARWGVVPLTGDAVFIASELVENALRHARSECLLRLELRPEALSVSVRDQDSRPAVLTTENSPRGLELVAQMCLAWGNSPYPGGGKVVWAVLPRNRHAGE
ncbi:ATP-binding protein [Lentzea sp. NPDC051838]|uniref:ATP-binding protein n=1 Tax=Lentzea sp. NPDC051838 TaxID=3154849 RepID=UPI00344ABB0D